MLRVMVTMGHNECTSNAQREDKHKVPTDQREAQNRKADAERDIHGVEDRQLDSRDAEENPNRRQWAIMRNRIHEQSGGVRDEHKVASNP